MPGTDIRRETNTIESCCKKIEQSSQPDEIRSETRRIRECCDRIERNL